MFRKMAFAASLFLVSQFIHAEGAPYIGAITGFDYTSFHYANSGVLNDPQASGVFGGPILGFGADLEDSFYLSAEIAGIGSSIKTGNLVDTTHGIASVLKKQWGYGISVLPGYRASEALTAYIRAGAARQQFSITQTTAATGQHSSTVSATGVLAGVGLEFVITRHTFFRTEYMYTHFFEIKTLASTLTSDNHQLALSIGYRFF